jgi:hypothetical protein
MFKPIQQIHAEAAGPSTPQQLTTKLVDLSRTLRLRESQR